MKCLFVVALTLTVLAVVTSLAFGEMDYGSVSCAHLNTVDSPSCDSLCAFGSIFFGATLNGTYWNSSSCACTFGFMPSVVENITICEVFSVSSEDAAFDCEKFSIYDDESCDFICYGINDVSGSFDGNDCICTTNATEDKLLCTLPSDDSEGSSNAAGASYPCEVVRVRNNHDCTDLCADTFDVDNIMGVFDSTGCNCTLPNDPVTYPVCTPNSAGLSQYLNGAIASLNLPAQCVDPFRQAFNSDVLRCVAARNLEFPEVDDYYQNGFSDDGVRMKMSNHSDDNEQEYERLERSVSGFQFDTAICTDSCLSTFLRALNVLDQTNCLSTLNLTNFDHERESESESDSRNRREMSSNSEDSSDSSDGHRFGDALDSFRKLYRLVPLFNLYCTSGGAGNCGDLAAAFRNLNGTTTPTDCSLIVDRGMCLGNFRTHLNDRLAGSGDAFVSKLTTECNTVNIDLTAASTGTEPPATLSSGFAIVSSVTFVVIASIMSLLF